MWAFQYKHGDRPLDGYTIQRAAGRGGFGEVYYAVSDSGREVALKVVQGYEQIELRGISQCMNLKSPHLVSIFDVRHNAENKPFVIMEFVSGPNLRQILDESPAGIGTQKAAFFLREIAKGLSFLHDCGIVHRDLKPANIFFENGYVKIGDYGLSKAISTSQHSGQTVTVGTVHYMAPEIGAGKYDRSIDIYALGAVLYEMLTGTPPYLGASPSEVLMKHLASEPDVSGIPQPFATVIKKAMAKDPAQRYQTAQQMVEDVFGAEHVRQSVSVFSPEDLSIVAERVAQRAKVAVGAGGSSIPPAQAGARQQARPDVWQRLGGAVDRAAGQIGTLDYHGTAPIEVNDPLAPRHRWMLAIVVSVVAGIAGTVVSMRAMGPPIVSMLFIFTCAWGAAVGVFVASRTIIPRMRGESPFLQKVVIGLIASTIAMIVSLPTWAWSSDRRTGMTLVAIMLPLLFIDTRKWFAFDRAERVRLGTLIGAGFAGFMANIFLNGNLNLVIATLAGAAMLVQILSPWDPIAGGRTKAKEDAGEEDEDEDDESKTSASPAIPDPRFAAGPQARATPSGAPASATFTFATSGSAQYWYRPVWRFARLIWLGAVVVLLTVGIMLCVAGGVERNPNDVGPLVAIGVCMIVGAVFSFLKSFQQRYVGLWGYLIKPVLLLSCLFSVLISSIVMGNMISMNSEDAMVGTFFIVFPTVLAGVLMFVPGRRKIAPSEVPPIVIAEPAKPGAPAPMSILPSPAVAAAKVKEYAESRRARREMRRRRRRAMHPISEQEWAQWAAARAMNRRNPFGTMLSFIAGVLILASVLLGLGLAFDLPGMIAAGVPDNSLAQEMQNHIFAGVSDWPRLLTKIASAASIVLMMLGVVVMIWARRDGGAGHMIRGIIGAAGLLFAMTPLREAIRSDGMWTGIAACMTKKEVGAATEVFLNQVQSGAAIASAAMFLVFLILLAWPAPRAKQPKAMAFAFQQPQPTAPQASINPKFQRQEAAAAGAPAAAEAVASADAGTPRQGA